MDTLWNSWTQCPPEVWDLTQALESHASCVILGKSQLVRKVSEEGWRAEDPREFWRNVC